MWGPGAVSASPPLGYFLILTLAAGGVGGGVGVSPKEWRGWEEVPGDPLGGLAVTVPMFSYCPVVAVPLPEQCMVSPIARVLLGQATATPRLSVTWTLLRAAWPQLVTA